MILAKTIKINLTPRCNLDDDLANALAKLPESDRDAIQQAISILSDEIPGVGQKIALEVLGKLGLLLTQEEVSDNCYQHESEIN